MTARDDLDRRLAAWMTETASDPPPAGRFELVVEATANQRPLPRWLAGFGSDWFGTRAQGRFDWAWPGPRRELVLSVAVALLIAAAIVGAVLVGTRLQGPGPLSFRLDGLVYSANSDIYVISAEGEPPVLIADGREGGPGYWDPQWSPDGRYLMYHDTSSTSSTVHVTDPEGNQVASFPGWYSTWARDSSRIATWEWDGGIVDVRTPDGRLLTTVTTTGLQGSGDQRPGWLPDGSAIVLPRYRLSADGPEGLQPWVLPIDGGPPRPLSPEVKGYRPAFSPDGSRIAIDAEEGLSLTAADGTGAQLLLGGSGSWPNMQPLWSPDGDRIAVTHKEGGTAPGSTGTSPMSIQVVDVATGRAVTVHTSSAALLTAVDWSPDGQAILVVESVPDINSGDVSVWSVPVDGSGGHIIVERTYVEGPDWRWVADE